MTREDKMHPPIDELALYSGGDCGFFDKWRIARHLASCPECTAEIKSSARLGRTSAPRLRTCRPDLTGTVWQKR